MPQFDIHVEIEEKDSTRLRKATNYIANIVHHSSYGPGNDATLQVHLVIHIHGGRQKHSYIVPLAYVLLEYESTITRPGRYQVYRHSLFPRYETPKSTREEHLADATTYIGITKRSWQQRYREHTYAAGRGSQVRLHKAIRGQMFKVGVFEHEILRAGINAKEALQIEEDEVERFSLFSDANPLGLNMIPGGGGRTALPFAHDQEAERED